MGKLNGRLAAAGLAILAAGALLTWWTAHAADRQMHAALLQQARQVAAAISLPQVTALSGTEADLAAPEYLRLKVHLLQTRHAFPQCRFLYLMGQKPDGAIFFFVE